MTDREAFRGFLDTVAAAVPRVVSRGNWKSPDGETILVGWGSYAAAGQAPLPVLVLNNKAAENRFGQAYTSLARLVAAPPAGLFEAWTLAAEGPLSPAEVFQRATLVVEDASPDSVIGILLVLMRVGGLAPETFPADWIEAIDQWERDGTVEAPGTAWTALASALAHRHFSVGKAATDVDNVTAWRETLSFAVQCLRREVHPHAVPDLTDMALWRAAQVALRQEEQTYLGWLPHAAQVQLSLPVSGANERRLLVDGLLFTEDQSTGAAKVFYRNDRAHAPLGQGFTLAAHYRPAESGSGNDFTIALDPRRGVHLEELWDELERRETTAWAASGIARPSDTPRVMEELQNRWNEPWYLKRERDLIGAPRAVEIVDAEGVTRKVPGTRLAWSDVRDALWTVFNPLRGVNVHPMGLRNGEPVPGEPCALLDLRSVKGTHDHAKHLLLAKWPPDRDDIWAGLSPRALGASPIVDRVIAGLIGRHDSCPVGLDALPPSGSWQKIELSGGFAILTHDGLFVLDDWQERALHALPEICACFHQAAALDHQLGNFERHDVEHLSKAMAQAIAKKQAWKTHGKVILAASAASVALADLRSRAARIPRDPDVRRIREALDQQWGLERRLASLEQQVTSISEALKSLGEARLLGVTRFVGIFGFGPYLAENLAGPLASWVRQQFYHASTSDTPAAWLWWVCFFAISGAIAGALQLRFMRNDAGGDPAGAASRHGHPPNG
jgi:hypothetical protein